ncbi:hypothetical protein BH20VER2_BH20VER2_05010 [soil metagenome]
MLFFKQLELFFSGAPATPAPETRARPRGGRDPQLESEARALLLLVGATTLIPLVQVEWNPRLRTAAGRADFRRALVSLNPQLHEHGAAEVDRTLRHELGHLVAHARAGRRRIAPHGPEWRQACADLGIADEQRCHTLPFPARRPRRRFLYRCPKCAREFRRVRRLRRVMACLACCRQFAGGRFSNEFQLRLVRSEWTG